MKEEIKNFLKNKDKNGYRLLLDKYIKDYAKCRVCGDVIYYYDSILRVSKEGEVYLDKKSYLTSKTIGDKVYNLCVCEDCLTKKYPEYQDKNKSRVFNMVNPITAYAFDIPEKIWKEWKNKNYIRTLDNYVNNFGKEEGERRWKIYCKKQSITNTFEYKNKKYGWTEEQFKEFNKSRSVTLERCIERHGEEKGLEIWNNYIERQRYTTSKEYFVEEYGEVKGIEKWSNWIENKTFVNGYSKVSQDLFLELDKHFKLNETYFFIKNKEFVVNRDGFCYFLDYYIKDLNLVVEFNGDLWHANPKKYKKDDTPIPFDKDLLAKEIWKRDKIRKENLESIGIKTIVVWEGDYYKEGIEKTIEKLKEEINNFIK